MGYLSDWIGIRARYLRCDKEWEPHLAYCRVLIVKYLWEHPEVKSVAFCGSGWGLDLPWESREFLALDQIVLLDLIHPWSVRRRALFQKNLTFMTCDLSGVIERMNSGPGLPPPEVDLKLSVDLVVSLNLIGQLPIMPLEVKSQDPKIREEELQEWARMIQRKHLEMLRSWAPRQMLIADIEEQWRDETGKIVDRADPWYGSRPFEMDEQWEWNLAPLGEIERKRSKHHVVGVKFLSDRF
jgi:hypothetical protein